MNNRTQDSLDLGVIAFIILLCVLWGILELIN